REGTRDIPARGSDSPARRARQALLHRHRLWRGGCHPCTTLLSTAAEGSETPGRRPCVTQPPQSGFSRWLLRRTARPPRSVICWKKLPRGAFSGSGPACCGPRPPIFGAICAPRHCAFWGLRFRDYWSYLVLIVCLGFLESGVWSWVCYGSGGDQVHLRISKGT